MVSIDVRVAAKCLIQAAFLLTRTTGSYQVKKSLTCLPCLKTTITKQAVLTTNRSAMSDAPANTVGLTKIDSKPQGCS